MTTFRPDRSSKDTEIHSILTQAHEEYAKALKMRAQFRIQDIATGEDLVQSTFLKTWSYLVRGGKVDTMKAFLYHVLNDLITDEYRKHKSTSLDILLDKGFEPYFDDTKRIVDILDGRSAISLIPKLPRKYQKVLHMKYVQGLTLEEMAHITGQSKNTVAVQAHRGIVEMRNLYFDIPHKSKLKARTRPVLKTKATSPPQL